MYTNVEIEYSDPNGHFIPVTFKFEINQTSIKLRKSYAPTNKIACQ